MNAPLNISTKARLADLSDSRERERIGAFVREHRGAVFHRPLWLLAVERGTGQRGAGIVTEQLGAITGWLPLSEVRSPLFGKALVSSGFGVSGGVLAENEEAAKALVQAAQDHALDRGYGSVELRGGKVPSGWTPIEGKHSGFERSLAEDDEAELLAIPRKARAEVRKGLKNGLTVKIGRDPADLAAHYRVYSQSVRNLGTPVFPKGLFRAMIEAFGEGADILTVERDGKPLSSVLSFYHNGAVMPFWGGGTHSARGARANELMYYELMLHARRKGMERFDFGRSKTGSGPFNFKKNWGFRPEPLVYSSWSAPGHAVRDVDPNSAAYARKIDLWKKLPLPIANLVGPFIARGLA